MLPCNIDRWAGGFMGWGQQVRIRHVTSGRYLGITHDHNVVTVHRGKADEDTTSFYLRQTKASYTGFRSINLNSLDNQLLPLLRIKLLFIHAKFGKI
ncbi:hypothetical protein DPMN_097567 [Dreissena polymorpha]|uniref:MIR domain-containing protein n=1 Tax=Dreissena polymorpha TaxID=45954 RepID=A0A9D4LAH5_DREPO|nr:hypothetical protein DPMN_097567 [Dreissena polymorpha]